MANVKLKPAAKIMIVLLLAGAGFGVYTFLLKGKGGDEAADKQPTANSNKDPATQADTPVARGGKIKVALSAWPGHMPLVVANGGMTTAPGSAAAKEGLDLEIVIIEDAMKKNAALQTGQVDFVWQVVDEMPLNMVGYKNTKTEVQAFLQLDWSRGGDACVASADVQKVEDILGKKSAMMMFSPDHTVFEFMINNSRLSPEQIAKVRKDTSFSMDDFTFGRVLFTQGKVDVACLWEPDVTLALEGRPGSHRLFSTADATELIADVLLTKTKTLADKPEVAAKLARVWFAGVEESMANKQAAARLVATAVPRFRDELGADGTAKAFEWVQWTGLAENARFFGVQGGGIPPFDRVYNQADTVWSNYPDAKLTERFSPGALRTDKIVRKLWVSKPEAAKPVVVEPEYDPKVAETGKAVFTKPVTINFDSGKADLDPESMHILNTQVLPQLEMARGMYVRVEGNTDNVGNSTKNQQLSELRARAVVDFLVSKGLDPKRITGKGNGDKSPIATNKTQDGKAQNRRTDILFISREEG